MSASVVFHERRLGEVLAQVPHPVESVIEQQGCSAGRSWRFKSDIIAALAIQPSRVVQSAQKAMIAAIEGDQDFAGGTLLMRGRKLTIQRSDNLNLVVFFVVFGFLAITGSMASAANVGFETIQVSNGTEPPLPGGTWYPTAAPATEHSFGFSTQTVAVGAPISGHDLPLVVLSHGGGSSYEAHYDTALALAHAGFVAAAIDHAGDTYHDQSQVLRFVAPPGPASAVGVLHVGPVAPAWEIECHTRWRVRLLQWRLHRPRRRGWSPGPRQDGPVLPGPPRS
jgi:hypothetical protein